MHGLLGKLVAVLPSPPEATQKGKANKQTNKKAAKARPGTVPSPEHPVSAAQRVRLRRRESGRCQQVSCSWDQRKDNTRQAGRGRGMAGSQSVTHSHFAAAASRQ